MPFRYHEGLPPRPRPRAGLWQTVTWDGMKQIWKSGLVLSGCAALAGALLHVAIVFGGPAWFRFFGAPEGIIRMAAAGHWYPTAVCLAISAVLALCAAYAFSGAGLIRRLPFLPLALALMGTVLCLRGVAFVPLMLLAPGPMASITSSTGVDAFLVVTSGLCLAVGVSYLSGYANVRAAGRGRAGSEGG